MTETAVDITVDEPEKVDYQKLIRMDRAVAVVLSLQGILSEIEDILATDPKHANTLFNDAVELSYDLSDKIEQEGGRLDESLRREKQGISPGETERPMDYQLVTASGASELTAAVDEQNSKGWNVSGGMVIGPDGSFYQPMTKHNTMMDW